LTPSVLGALATLLLTACSGSTSSLSSSTPSTTVAGTSTVIGEVPPAATTSPDVPPVGLEGFEAAQFGRGELAVTDADGFEFAAPVWVARTPDQHNRGLMEVTEIPGANAGMVFVFDEPTAARFFMLRTRLPLTIAFVADGRVTAVVDMAPCPNDDDDPPCPRYSAPGPYSLAIEVPLGTAAALGLEVGATAALVAT
jgi:uncharacterized membrane protein (UPF0127 family)